MGIEIAVLRGRINDLNAALVHRDIVGMAKGMLMERYDISAEEAFELLRKLSQESNIKLRNIAQQVLDHRG